MVVSPHPDEQRVGSDRLSGGFAQVSDENRVVIGAGRLHQQVAQERLAGIGQLHELEGGGDAEEAFEIREQADGENRRADASDPRPEGMRGPEHGVAARDHADHAGQGRPEEARDQARPGQVRPLADAGHREDGRQGGSHADDGGAEAGAAVGHSAQNRHDGRRDDGNHRVDEDLEQHRRRRHRQQVRRGVKRV
ncbi:hypothetical protein D3C87_1532710 [compost metagenome]